MAHWIGHAQDRSRTGSVTHRIGHATIAPTGDAAARSAFARVFNDFNSANNPWAYANVTIDDLRAVSRFVRTLVPEPPESDVAMCAASFALRLSAFEAPHLLVDRAGTVAYVVDGAPAWFVFMSENPDVPPVVPLHYAMCVETAAAAMCEAGLRLCHNVATREARARRLPVDLLDMSIALYRDVFAHRKKAWRNAVMNETGLLEHNKYVVTCKIIDMLALDEEAEERMHTLLEMARDNARRVRERAATAHAEVPATDPIFTWALFGLVNTFAKLPAAGWREVERMLRGGIANGKSINAKDVKDICNTYGTARGARGGGGTPVAPAAAPPAAATAAAAAAAGAPSVATAVTVAAAAPTAPVAPVAPTAPVAPAAAVPAAAAEPVAAAPAAQAPAAAAAPVAAAPAAPVVAAPVAAAPIAVVPAVEAPAALAAEAALVAAIDASFAARVDAVAAACNRFVALTETPAYAALAAEVEAATGAADADERFTCTLCSNVMFAPVVCGDCGYIACALCIIRTGAAAVKDVHTELVACPVCRNVEMANHDELVTTLRGNGPWRFVNEIVRHGLKRDGEVAALREELATAHGVIKRLKAERGEAGACGAAVRLAAVAFTPRVLAPAPSPKALPAADDDDDEFVPSIP
jgi:hypothetical protein